MSPQTFDAADNGPLEWMRTLPVLAVKRALMEDIVARYCNPEHVGDSAAWLDLCYLCLQIGSYSAMRTASVCIDENKGDPAVQEVRRVCLYLLQDVRGTLSTLRANGVGGWQRLEHLGPSRPNTPW